MLAQLLTIIFLFSALAPKALAQTKKPLDVNRQMSISYGSPSWNTDSTKIDTAFLILRDKNSGKLVQIDLRPAYYSRKGKS